MRYLIILLMFFCVSCGDKIQTAKTAAAFIELGRQTAKSAFQTIQAEKTKECLKLGSVGSDQYKECMKKITEAVDFYEKLEPQIIQAQDVLKKAIMAAESGQTIDLLFPVQSAVCLLVKCRVWLPDTWTKKINVFLDMAGNFTCGPSASFNDLSRDDQIKVANNVLRLLNSI